MNDIDVLNHVFNLIDDKYHISQLMRQNYSNISNVSPKEFGQSYKGKRNNKKR